MTNVYESIDSKLLTACKAVKEWLAHPKGQFPSETAHLVLEAVDAAEAEPENIDDYVAEKAKRELVETFRRVNEYLTASEFSLALGQALVEVNSGEEAKTELPPELFSQLSHGEQEVFKAIILSAGDNGYDFACADEVEVGGLTTEELEARYLIRLEEVGLISYEETFVNDERIVQICATDKTGIDGCCGTFGDLFIEWAGGTP